MTSRKRGFTTVHGAIGWCLRLARSNWKSLTAGLLAGYLLFFGPLALIWQDASEVSGQGWSGMLFCPERSPFCSAAYHYQLGNTGKRNQQLVTLVFRDMPPATGVSSRYLNIISNNPRPHNPTLTSRQAENGVLRVEIRDLGPGALVEIDLTNQRLNRDQAVQWRELRAEVVAAGRVLNVPPRATVVGRLFRVLLGFWL